MRLLSTLPLMAAAAACLLVPSQAAAAPLPAGSTAILSGTPSLDGKLPTPVGVVNFGRFTVSANGRFIAFASTSDGLSDADDDHYQNIFVKDVTTGTVTLASRRDGADGAPVRGQCSDPSISDDGSTVAFRCDAPLEGVDTNNAGDVYVRRLTANETILVSRVPSGAVGDQQSFLPVLSADGSVVVFESLATNLGAGNMSSNEHVYRRDLKPGGALTVVSRRSAADGGAVTTGGDPSVSDDGNVIAWAHQGSGPPDPNDTNGKFDVYVTDAVAGTTVIASVATNGTRGDGPSGHPAIAGDGSAVAFDSQSTVFDPADTEPGLDIYRRTLGANPTTALVSIEGATKGVDSRLPSISADGRMVAFGSRATGFDGADADPEYSAYVRDMQTPQIRLLNRGDGDEGAFIPGFTLGVSTSGDGKKFAAVSADGRGVPGADRYGTTLFLRDLGSSPARTHHVSRPPGEAPFVNVGGLASTPRLSADARYAAFLTRAPQLVPDGLAGAIVVRDRVTGELTIASRADGANGAFLDGDSDPSISADGRRIAFVVHEGPLYSVWVRDLATNRTYLASRATGEQGAPADAHAFSPLLAADGSRVVFRTKAKLDPTDTDALEDIYVRDLETNTTILASRATSGDKGNGNSSITSGISADGTKVLFLSTATNLAGGDTDPGTDAYLRDLENGSTILAGAGADGTKPNAPVTFASFDAAARRIAFATAATNLGVDTPHSKAFVRDLEAGSLTLASRVDGSDATPLNGPATTPVLSPDGGYVAFKSSATDLPGTAVGAPAAGFLHDLERRTTQVVTRASGVDGAPVREAINDTMVVSKGGGCVTFATGAALFGPYGDARQAYIRAVRAECAPADPEPQGPGEPDEPGGGPAGPDGGGTDGGPGGGGGPGTGGGPVGQRDAVAPALGAARLSRKRIRVGQKSVLSFRSDEAATLALTYERVRGKRVKRAGASTHTIKVGTSRITLTGRVGRKRLAAGTYRITLVARDAAGNQSKPVRLRLTILKKKA